MSTANRDLADLVYSERVPRIVENQDFYILDCVAYRQGAAGNLRIFTQKKNSIDVNFRARKSVEQQSVGEIALE